MTTAPTDSNFVTPDWLAARLGQPGLAVVDGSWYLPAHNRDPEAEYRARHIPGAVRFDIDAVRDTGNPLPHMLPSAESFAAAASAMGIGDGTTIVVYDGMGLFSAPRVWWTFKVFGARQVFILKGGLPAWIAAGHPVSDAIPAPKPQRFTARFNAGAVTDAAGVATTLADGSAQIVDARPADRFRGEAPEPRPGLRAGHMPGALNVPATAVIADGALKSAEAIRQAFTAAGVALDRPIVTSCGSGVTAAILTLALDEAGVRTRALYDGSWAEWGGRDDLPVVKG